MERKGMENAQALTINGLDVRVPEPTFNALLVFLHSWEHMMTLGTSVRQLCDLTLLLHHYAGRIDVPLLKRCLAALHLTDVWHLFAYCMHNGLGLPVEECLFYSDKVAARGERLLEDLLGGRLFEPKSTEEAPKNRIARKLHTMKERFRNAERMGQYSPAYAWHMKITVLVHGAGRFFAKDRHWE
jgi:hypothetical protein